MAEVKELEQQVAPQEPTPPAAAPQKNKKKKKLVRRIVALAVAAGLVAGGVVYFRGKGEPEAQVVTDFVTYGSITSTVEGSGLTKSKNSETLMLTTDGVVQEVFVTEGQKVMAGDPLFIIESEGARVAVEKARQNLEGYEKQLGKQLSFPTTLMVDSDGCVLASIVGAAPEAYESVIQKLLAETAAPAA